MCLHVVKLIQCWFIVRRAGLLLSQQDFEWRWSVPLFQCLTVLEFSFILFDLCLLITFLARWLTSARAYRIGGRKLCPSVCLYVKRYLLLQFCTDYNQTWINMIWAVAAKTLLSQFFHNWRRIEVNCVYISHCKWYRTSAGMPACIPNRRCCAGQCAGQ